MRKDKSCVVYQLLRSLFKESPIVYVVKCKNCMYKEKAKVNNKGFLICPISGMEITDDDYCSYGERKVGENNA